MRPLIALHVLGLTVLCGCPARQPLATTATPLVDLNLDGATGVERVLKFSHPQAAAHLGVDAVRMPFLDPVVGEMRDNELLVSAGGTGIYAALVDDRWNRLREVYWSVPGQTVPWSDVRVARITDVHGQQRVMIYHVSRGTNLLQITDATNFPNVTTTAVPIDLGLPVAVNGAHTLQVHEGRGVLVLNGVDVGAGPVPAPLTVGGAPAAFYDIATDPMAPRLLSLFVGSISGTQILFDSQFLRLGGMDVWAPTIDLPALQVSGFEFYEFTDPAHMQNARKLADYRGPTSGQAHNVVQLPDAPDGSPRLAAGFEAFAWTASMEQIVAKAAVLDATALTSGQAPTFITWLKSEENHHDAVHNPCSRLLEVGSHTFDTVPLAHFTGGYYLYEYADGAAQPIAHVPVSTITASGRLGHRHATMTVPVWMAGYNGAWDMVATNIGDYVSSTDREASFLIEPTYGFSRQYGTYVPQANGTVPRVRLAGALPQAGDELRVRCTGLLPGGLVTLTVARRALAQPIRNAQSGALWFDQNSVVTVLAARPTGTSVEFVVPNPPGLGGQLVLTAIEHGVATPTGVLKSPACIFRVRPTPP